MVGNGGFRSNFIFLLLNCFFIMVLVLGICVCGGILLIERKSRLGGRASCDYFEDEEEWADNAKVSHTALK